MTSDDKRQLAHQRLRARRRHDGDLRRRSLFLSLLVFAVLWLAIFTQMVSGHDPVLTAKQKNVAGVHRRVARVRHVAAGASEEPAQAPAPSPSSTESAPAAPVQPAPTPIAPTPVVTSQS